MNIMYILVLAENNISASFICRGLKYENILSKPMVFDNDALHNLNINDFDCIVVKMPVSPSLTLKYLTLINEAKIAQSLFILINREFFLLNDKKVDIGTKFI